MAKTPAEVRVPVVPVLDEAALEALAERVAQRIRQAVREGVESAEVDDRTLVRIAYSDDDLAAAVRDSALAASAEPGEG